MDYCITNEEVCCVPQWATKVEMRNFVKNKHIDYCVEETNRKTTLKHVKKKSCALTDAQLNYLKKFCL